MYIPNYPEDSTLRRHHESAAEFRRQESLAGPPSDSVLRRHYEQLLNAASTPAAARRAPPTPEAARSPAPQPPARHSGSGGGFLAWLRRLFG